MGKYNNLILSGINCARKLPFYPKQGGQCMFIIYPDVIINAGRSAPYAKARWNPRKRCYQSCRTYFTDQIVISISYIGIPCNIQGDPSGVAKRSCRTQTVSRSCQAAARQGGYYTTG